MKTRTQVKQLKQLWLDDKSAFDLPNTAGYEEYKEELEAFVKKHKEEEEPDIFDIIKTVASSIGETIIKGNKVEKLDDIAEIIFKKQMSEGILISNDKANTVGYLCYEAAYHFLQGRERFMNKIFKEEAEEKK